MSWHCRSWLYQKEWDEWASVVEISALLINDFHNYFNTSSYYFCSDTFHCYIKAKLTFHKDYSIALIASFSWCPKWV
jgi:hypothetical protein